MICPDFEWRCFLKLSGFFFSFLWFSFWMTTVRSEIFLQVPTFLSFEQKSLEGSTTCYLAAVASSFFFSATISTTNNNYPTTANNINSTNTTVTFQWKKSSDVGVSHPQKGMGTALSDKRLIRRRNYFPLILWLFKLVLNPWSTATLKYFY